MTLTSLACAQGDATSPQGGRREMGLLTTIRRVPRVAARKDSPAERLAGLLMTTEAMVAEKPKKESPMPAMPPSGGMDY